MSNELNLFDFLKILWTKKIFILFVSILFFILGYLFSLYKLYETKNYRTSSIINPLTVTQTQALSYLSKSTALTVNISENIYCRPGSTCRFYEPIYLLDFSPESKNLINEFYQTISSISFQLNGLKEVKFFEGSYDTDFISHLVDQAYYKVDTSDFEEMTEEQKEKIYIEFINGNNHIIRLDPSTDKILITIKYSEPQKSVQYIDWLIKNANLSVTNRLTETIEKVIDLAKKDKLILDTTTKWMESSGLSSYWSEKYIEKQILITKKMDYLIEKLMINLGESNLDKFEVVNFDSKSIIVEEIKKYKVNYPLIGLIGGFLLGCILILIRRSYKDYKNTKNALENKV